MISMVEPVTVFMPKDDVLFYKNQGLLPNLYWTLPTQNINQIFHDFLYLQKVSKLLNQDLANIFIGITYTYPILLSRYKQSISECDTTESKESTARFFFVSQDELNNRVEQCWLLRFSCATGGSLQRVLSVQNKQGERWIKATLFVFLISNLQWNAKK